ncbi:MAG: magnesium transporter [Planctomycetes bacterium DG_58]|nr:MAG: magnesium transporter [Planctomycetes bacterium DG_58]
MEWQRHSPPGTPPSTLVAPREAQVPETVHLFHYTEDSVEETDLADVKELARYRKKEGVTWVNVPGLGSVEMLHDLGELLSLHPLALEDVLQIPQRPKVDDYEGHLFVVLRMLHYEEAVDTEQVSIFLGSDYVVTFQERPGDCLDPIRERLRKGTGQLRRQGADYLMYAIIDTVIDNYFPFLEQVGEVVEDLEGEVVENPTRQTLSRVHDIKRGLLDVRRSVWPLRDAVNQLIREETPLIGKTAQLYLRDCYDHTIHVLDVVETYRELAGGLMDIYLSSVSNKMNEVMKVLTIIATIFIPLTFIAGIYGMNFEKMPELKWPWAYPLVWGVMVVVAIVMLLFFRHRGWLGGEKKD